MSVIEILKINSGTFFNQTSLNTHDSDQTINIGLGIRKLFDDDKVVRYSATATTTATKYTGD